MLSKFYYLLIFSPCSNQMNSSHCHLMELFKSKESCKKNLIQTLIAWPIMILEWHLFLRLSLGFVWKMLSFVGKQVFTQKMSVHFLYFLLKWKGVNQQVCLIKYLEIEICNSTSHKKRERSKNISNFKSMFRTPGKFSLVTLVTNYHKSSLLPLGFRPWRKFEKQKLVLNFESCYCYFKWVIFS